MNIFKSSEITKTNKRLTGYCENFQSFWLFVGCQEVVDCNLDLEMHKWVMQMQELCVMCYIYWHLRL